MSSANARTCSTVRFELEAAGEDLLELLGLFVVEAVGAAGDPAGHVTRGRVLAGRIVVREGFPEPLHVLLDDAFAVEVAAFAEFLEQAAGDGAALGPPLVQVRLVGIEDAGAAGPASDEWFVRGSRMGESADGIASQAEPAGDDSQPESLVQQVVNGRVLLAYPIGQAAGLPRLGRKFRCQFRGLREHSGANRGDALRFTQKGAVLGDHLLDGLGEVLPDVPAVCDMDRVRGASRPASA
ncbi:hypothetical protein ACFTXM_39605 [Streptomyces sp. NPDC056930]|uniref:hypothetical protein n=1 Tax=Streptomyces sp. NPDC056930 TaxID=3345967 RepID=UPI0036452256